MIFSFFDAYLRFRFVRTFVAFVALVVTLASVELVNRWWALIWGVPMIVVVATLWVWIIAPIYQRVPGDLTDASSEDPS